MTVHATRDEELSTEPSEEERAHGLGNAADHARAKLRRVAVRHGDVFAALAAFVAEGHALTLVHGNHDVEFHWDMVKAEFRSILLAHALKTRNLATTNYAAFATSFFERIEFNPWFFYVQGVAYIEHGHQYDPLCASSHVMVPVSPADPRRIERGFCDVLLRFVVRRTQGLKEHGHGRLGLLDYVAFAIRLGAGGLVKLASSFASAVVELIRVQRSLVSDAARLLREEHDRRMTLLAETTRLGLDRLRALAALQVQPVTRTIRGILGSVLLDRLGIAIVAFLLSSAIAAFAVHRPLLWIGVGVVLAGWLAIHRQLTRSRKVDYDEELVERAGRLAKLFPAAFVVMGHTHTPVELKIAEGTSTYINVGSWAEQEADGEGASSYKAPRTHLVIHPGTSGAIAEFLRWEADGPRRFIS
jgi:hypothetical protein